MLLGIKLGIDQIKENQEAYDLSGKMSPNFVNDGNTPVQILNSIVKPGGQFSFQFDNTVFKNQQIPIRFRESGIDNPLKILNVYWGVAEKDCN